jgi:hypothetical protein
MSVGVAETLFVVLFVCGGEIRRGIRGVMCGVFAIGGENMAPA